MCPRSVAADISESPMAPILPASLARTSAPREGRSARSGPAGAGSRRQRNRSAAARARLPQWWRSPRGDRRECAGRRRSSTHLLASASSRRRCITASPSSRSFLPPPYSGSVEHRHARVERMVQQPDRLALGRRHVIGMAEILHPGLPPKRRAGPVGDAAGERRLERQSHVVLGDRRLRCPRGGDIVKLGHLHAPLECGLVGEAVHQGGELP